MKKVRFAGAQQRLPAPGFQVETIAGETISLDDYRFRSNLVLLFADGVEGERLDDTVQAFASRRREYEANDAQVIVMSTSAREPESAGSFPHVATDHGGEVRARYSGLLPKAPQPDEAVIFVLDRFATPHVAFLTRNPADPALHAKIISWLHGIELECPE